MSKRSSATSPWTTEIEDASESSDKEKNWKNPDGNIITVLSERLRCPKYFFRPNFIGKEASRIHDTTFQSIMETNADIREGLYSDVGPIWEVNAASISHSR